MKKLLIITSMLILVVVLSMCSGDGERYLKMETSMGDIIIDLYEEEAPLHAAQYTQWAEADSFAGIYFHRVMPGFVVQGGDPNTRANEDRMDDGMGGMGERIPAEIGQPHLRGTVGAARQPDHVNPEKMSNGSQFYFCLSRLNSLDGNYTVFGKVVEGMDVVDDIATKPTDPRDNPLETIAILKTSMVKASKYKKD